METGPKAGPQAEAPEFPGKVSLKKFDHWMDPETGVGTQYAALCYRPAGRGKVEVLLVTSRDTGRWVIPKGWPMKGRDPAGCALQEAWEEAGVKGEVAGGCLGIYSYSKVIGPERGIPVVVAVYPVLVRRRAGDFPEKHQRRARWMSPKKAAAKVAEPELAALLLAFDPLQKGDGTAEGGGAES